MKKAAKKKSAGAGAGAAKKKTPAKKKAKAKALSKPKPKTVVAKKAKTFAKTVKRVAKATPKAKANAKPKTKTRPIAAPPSPPISSRPSSPASRSALEVSSQIPEERTLTDEERDAMSKVAQTALVAVGAKGKPSDIVASIAAYVDDIRHGQRQPPSNQDVRLGLGVLWGEQVRAQVGWRWVHLKYPNGFASYALVPDDRAFACFPLNRVTELLARGAEGTNTSVPLFESIRQSHLPMRRENTYLIIG